MAKQKKYQNQIVPNLHGLFKDAIKKDFEKRINPNIDS